MKEGGGVLPPSGFIVSGFTPLGYSFSAALRYHTEPSGNACEDSRPSPAGEPSAAQQKEGGDGPALCFDLFVMLAG